MLNDKDNIFPAPPPPTSPREAVIRSQIEARPFFDPTRRAIARHAGLPTYDDYCDTHGVTPFGVSSGSCDLCTRPRAVARRTEANTYLAPCPCSPEPTEHSVQTGKCLGCFATNGRRRRADGPGRPPQTDNPRAQARRAGVTTYTAACETHGETAHSVVHGKCLTCFTTAGAPRKRLDGLVTGCELSHALVGIAQHLERERGPAWETRRATILAAARRLGEITGHD